jgi:hypothetical protein
MISLWNCQAGDSLSIKQVGLHHGSARPEGDGMVGFTALIVAIGLVTQMAMRQRAMARAPVRKNRRR